MSGWYNRSKVSKTNIPPRTDWTPQLRDCTPRNERLKIPLNGIIFIITNYLYSTVTDLARLRGLSTSQPRVNAA